MQLSIVMPVYNEAAVMEGVIQEHDRDIVPLSDSETARSSWHGDETGRSA